MNSLLSALQNPELYPHPVTEFAVIETHISWVLLTGDYAYKIKKPVNFGFLDFSTLAQRKFFCQEELRLNQRLAAEIYLEVVSITGTPEQPALNGDGAVFEYAVKMRQFPQSAQFDRLLQQGQLSVDQIQSLAHTVAQFHQCSATADTDTVFANPDVIKQAVDENFFHILPTITDSETRAQLQAIAHWCETEHQRCYPEFTRRKQEAYVRECHGDMHLRNIALMGDAIIVFDCIEFNEAFRWIDVMSEIAFVIMDLDDRNQSGFATTFLNQYLEDTGDYNGLTVLPYYLVYRAMVRAKVACLRLAQAELTSIERDQVLSDLRHYLDLAWRYTKPHAHFLCITHGLSGSGKSWLTDKLMNGERFIRLRSDVERKRLYHLTAEQDSNSRPGTGIYSQEATEMTYQRLKEITSRLLEKHWSVIVDATFLQCSQRESFHQLASSLKAPFLILDFQATPALLRDRIRARQSRQNVSEATLEVLERQISHYQALSLDEQHYCLSLHTATAPAQVWRQIHKHLTTV